MPRFDTVACAGADKQRKYIGPSSVIAAIEEFRGLAYTFKVKRP
jgi:hypothetical protein